MRDHQPLQGAPAVRSADALVAEAKAPLKELLDQYHVEPQYKAERLTTAPANEPLQWGCQLRCPALKQPGSGDVVLPEATFEAQGRGKAEAEQRCARMALEHAAKAGVPLP